jgi:hypothetical protein
MEKMDMHSRNEYLKVIMESYFKARTSKEKTQLLDEYPDIIRVIPDTREGTSFGRYTRLYKNLFQQSPNNQSYTNGSCQSLVDIS